MRDYLGGWHVLDEIQGMISQLKGWIKAMYDITPNDGAYFNEVRPVRSTRDDACGC